MRTSSARSCSDTGDDSRSSADFRLGEFQGRELTELVAEILRVRGFVFEGSAAGPGTAPTKDCSWRGAESRRRRMLLKQWWVRDDEAC